MWLVGMKIDGKAYLGKRGSIGAGVRIEGDPAFEGIEDTEGGTGVAEVFAEGCPESSWSRGCRARDAGCKDGGKGGRTIVGSCVHCLWVSGGDGRKQCS